MSRQKGRVAPTLVASPSKSLKDHSQDYYSEEALAKLLSVRGPAAPCDLRDVRLLKASYIIKAAGTGRLPLPMRQELERLEGYSPFFLRRRSSSPRGSRRSRRFRACSRSRTRGRARSIPTRTGALLQMLAAEARAKAEANDRRAEPQRQELLEEAGRSISGDELREASVGRCASASSSRAAEASLLPPVGSPHARECLR